MVLVIEIPAEPSKLAVPVTSPASAMALAVVRVAALPVVFWLSVPIVIFISVSGVSATPKSDEKSRVTISEPPTAEPLDLTLVMLPPPPPPPAFSTQVNLPVSIS